MYKYIFENLAASCDSFAAHQQCRRYGGGKGGPCPPQQLFVPPISVYPEYGYVTSRNDKTTGNNGTEIITFKHKSSLTFFRFCEIAGHQLLLQKCDAIIRLPNTSSRMCPE